ncbi:hypothetical protein B0I31_109116 [Saccharothrix carnea]|uniref:Uncharacterized protein n=2 Tax=Saccharothrix carnea TaxID=1280637 RepID=A0A2P8I4C7_SACCR|nr:hypothetical protein B0I31_109116 [Saccharothrix carnea]
MTEMMSGVENPEDAKAKAALKGLDEQLVGRTRAGGLKLRSRIEYPTGHEPVNDIAGNLGPSANTPKPPRPAPAVP